MTAAFDWSPGGCCCKVPGFFDVYWTGQTGLESQRLVRAPTMFTPTVHDDSWTLIGWGIDKSAVGAGANVVPAGAELVWSQEVRDGAPANATVMCLYDPVARQELLATNLPNTAPAGGGVINMLGGCSPTAAGQVFNKTVGFGLSAFQVAGDWHEVLASGGVRTGNFGGVQQTFRVSQRALRHWPFWSCVTAHSPLSPPPVFEWSIGELNPSADTIELTVVYSRQGTSGGQWVCFDHTPAGWAGVVSFTDSSSMVHEVLLINGNEIEDRIVPSGFPGTRGFGDFMHVAYGSGEAIIARREGTTSSWRLRCYSGSGGLLWESAPGGGDSQCWASSDNWLYCFVSGAIAAAMPNLQFPFVDDNGQRHWYLVKRDGSQTVPMGTLNDNGTVTRWAEPGGIDENALIPGMESGRADVVHDSTLIEQSLPADAQDFI